MAEVIVVGASVAGCATAIHLARAGRSVLLLDQRPAYRREACGEGIFPRGVRALEALGIRDAVSHQGRELQGVRLRVGEVSAEARFPPGSAGLGIDRAHLDTRLLHEARAAGVEVRLGERVHGLVEESGAVVGVRTAAGQLRSRCVIAADGRASRLRHEAGLDRPGGSARFGISAHVRLERDAGTLIDIAFSRGIETYVTPVGPDVVNVAILLRRERLAALPGTARSRFTALLAEHGRGLGTASLLDEPVAAGPFDVRASRTWRPHLLLVGDAAGFFDAIEGEGISTALTDACSASAAVDAYLRDGSEAHFRRHADARERGGRGARAIARLMLAVAPHPALARRAVRNLARQPATFERLLGVSTGDVALRSIRPDDAVALLTGWSFART